jgi:hypothetical protein
MDFLWWQLIVLIIVGTGAISFLISRLQNSKKKLFIKKAEETTLGISEDDIDSKEVEDTEKKIDGALNDKAKDYIILIHKTISYSDKKHQIFSSIIRDQMNYADLILKQVETGMNKEFVDLIIEEKGRDIDLLHEVSYVIFHGFVRILISETLMKMKQSFRENHFSTRTDFEFKDYIENQENKLIYGWENLFDNQYIHGLKPNPDDLKKRIQSQNIFIGNIIKDCFYTAREIAIAKEKEMKDAEEEFYKECKEFSGADIATI